MGNSFLTLNQSRPHTSRNHCSNYSHGFRWVERTLNHQTNPTQNNPYPSPLDYDVYLEDKAQSSTTWMDSWTITTALINEIQTLCTNQQVDVQYVLLPSLEEVSILRQRTLATEYPSLMLANYKVLMIQSLPNCNLLEFQRTISSIYMMIL